MYKRTILIDLDGVLNTYTGGYDENFIPPIREEAKEFLEQASENFDLKLFTTRPNVLTQKWLEENEIKQYFSEVTNIKKPAWLIIDDRCVTFDGNFKNLSEQVSKFKPWYKE